MKKYSVLIACGVVVAAGGLWGLGASWGQEAAAIEAGETPAPKPVKAKVLVRGGGGYSVAGESRFRGNPDGKELVTLEFRGGDPMQTIREAAAALSAAEDDDARENAERELNELLNEYFEEDMKRREQELADVEARVTKLRELLERRREKRDDIIRLQIEVLRNEADGLGFFSGEGPRGPKTFQFHAEPFITPPGAGLPAVHPVFPGPANVPGTPPAPPSPGPARR
jgi:hypothetical protein